MRRHSTNLKTTKMKSSPRLNLMNRLNVFVFMFFSVIAQRASAVNTVIIEIQLLAHYSMPREKCITRESDPAKSYISGILSHKNPISPVICVIDLMYTDIRSYIRFERILCTSSIRIFPLFFAAV